MMRTLTTTRRLLSSPMRTAIILRIIGIAGARLRLDFSRAIWLHFSYRFCIDYLLIGNGIGHTAAAVNRFRHSIQQVRADLRTPTRHELILIISFILAVITFMNRQRKYQSYRLTHAMGQVSLS